MAYSYITPTSEQMETWIADGTIQRLYDDSKSYIDAGSHPFDDNMTDDHKRDYFITRFLSVYSEDSWSPDEHTPFNHAMFDDDKLIAIYCGHYDSSDTSANISITLFSPNKSGSKSYLYSLDYTTQRRNAERALGANKAHVWMQCGNGPAFRMMAQKSYENIGVLYEDVVHEDIEQHYYYERPAYTSIPTPDGISEEVPAEVVMDFKMTLTRFTLVFK